MDHDQRFKVLLREFFAEFIRLFFPDWVDHFDFTQVEWLDKEAFADPPEGERRYLDLVARLPVREPPEPSEEPADHWLVLIHIEIEAADRVAPLRRRIYQYREMLRLRHGLPVLSIGFYLRVALRGVDWDEYREQFWGEEVVHFRYPCIGLPGLNGEPYLRGENLLGVALAALMQLPEERRLELGQQAMLRVVESQENAYRRYLLGECINAYLPADEAQRREFEQRLRNAAREGGQEMEMTYFERMWTESQQKGRQEQLSANLLTLLEGRFGPISETLRQRLAAQSIDELNTLFRATITAASLAELGLTE